jgi:formylglycine-generating enzyme required for sulfatase activity
MERSDLRAKPIEAFERLTATPPRTAVDLPVYYIARYTITEDQYYSFTHGTMAQDIPGVLEEPETRIATAGHWKGQPVFERHVAAVRSDESARLLKGLGARFPTAEEWEKAARGTDGRLYPWGDEWDPNGGFFYYGQQIPSPHPHRGKCVTGFPTGVSPFGVWGMAGGLPELVTVREPRPIITRRRRVSGREVLIDLKGYHAKESSAEYAWFDHILTLPGYGFWVSLRPVLDKWPQTQWQGVGVPESERRAAPGAK